MKRIIKLTESDIKRIVNIVLEQEEENVDTEGYHDIDFKDAFISYFKEWLKNNQNVEPTQFPLSYLLRKYGNKFKKHIGYGKEKSDEDNDDEEEDDVEYYLYRNDPAHWGRHMVQKKMAKLPSLRQADSFLKNYGPFMERIKKSLELPDYVNVEFVEPRPYVLVPKLDIDFNKMLTTDDNFRPDKSRIKDQIANYIVNYLGLKLDTPVMGGVEVEYPQMEYVGMKEWLKNVFQNKIKKEIKSLPNSNQILRMGIEVENGRVKIKPVFRSSMSWTIRNQLKDTLKAYLQSLGYASNKISFVY